ncbi:MarR family winged helix-turn-helix transcriptional regulator [Phytohabitans sp. LJ34]|uniref:MarR family winged helix-turn-helix transcriptional regulator n=1 Tax=Phytohabitans sp. LJ34 TaxID=3452217 RepID=UPI003F8BFFCA
MAGPDRALGWTVVRLAHVLNRRFEDEMRPFGLTPTQFGVLATIATEPGIGSGQLARRVLVTPQSVGELVASLEAAGHVVRDRSGGRGRRAGIDLTSQGRSVLDRAARAADALNDPAIFGLDADEAATLNALLHRALAATQKPA